MKKRVIGFKASFIFIIVVLGLYLLNTSFRWITLPNFIVLNETTINGFAGALLIVLGIWWAFRRKRSDY
jgi:LPXTG-motif cell wall-anchored protein